VKENMDGERRVLRVSAMGEITEYVDTSFAAEANDSSADEIRASILSGQEHRGYKYYFWDEGEDTCGKQGQGN
jgi:hypothetical protein